MNIDWLFVERNGFWLVFAMGFLAVAALESRRPKLRASARAERRWGPNAILFAISAFVSTGLLRFTPVLVGLAVQDSPFGLLNHPWLPWPVRFAVAILAFDFSRYASHWCFHAVHFLWRIHHVHHSDPDFDVATGLRAHPFETILTQASALFTIAVLAPPVSAVVVAELLSCLQSFVTHANVSLPTQVDCTFRQLFVTSDMHRIHHSTDIAEQQRNYGELFAFWDRMFGTYQSQPAAGENGISVGLASLPMRESLSLPVLLVQPFRRDTMLQPATSADES
jgi:sterol desaturase/sphingolipid hydroxylase (fatty acid hydroxylase superfamily)